MRAYTEFRLTRDCCGIISHLTFRLPGDVSSAAIRIWVRNDAWCEELRDSGFELDEATIALVCNAPRE